MDDDVRRRFEQLEDIQRGDHDELLNVQAVLYGPNKDNGLRSEFRDLKGKFYKAVEEFTHKWDVERAETCLGIAECESMRAIIDERQKEDNAMEIAKVQTAGTIRAAKISGFFQTWGALIGLAGVIVALILKS